MVESKKDIGIRLICELEEIFKELPDKEFDDGVFERVDSLLLSILNPDNVHKHSNIQDFLLTNKNRSQLLAYIRHAITQNYSFRGYGENGKKIFVSPNHTQWYDDGVMFLEGEELFAGYIGLYINGEVRYALSNRDSRVGEIFEKDDLKFISIDEANTLSRELEKKRIKNLSSLEMPIYELEKMLKDHEKSESKYQEWIEKYPWILGLQYKTIQPHPIFDNENIPDFNGIRTHDDYRDIIEIKQPFLNLFRQDGGYTSEFNDSWNQVERYLLHVKENKDYLDRNKGLKFENPSCILIIGYDLSSSQREALRKKEKMNSAIKIYTYNDLIAYGKYTVDILKQMKLNPNV